jgi:hypothetical protein
LTATSVWFTFTALSTQSTLVFTDVSTGIDALDTGLDNVSVLDASDAFAANGDFSLPNISGNTFATVSILNWTSAGHLGHVLGDGTRGGITFKATGDQYALFNEGGGPIGGTHQQSFATGVGTEYTVSFEVMHLFSGIGDAALRADVFDGSTTSGTVLGSLTDTNSVPASVNPRASFTFTASSAQSTLVFTDVSTGIGVLDTGLDNVSMVDAAWRIADIAGDWVDKDTLPAGWSYLESDAATGGDESALTANTSIGNAGAFGFGGGGNHQTACVLGDNAAGGEYELFTDGSVNSAAVLGADLIMHPSDLAGGRYVIARYTFSISVPDVIIAGGFHGNASTGSRIGSVYFNGAALYTSGDSTPDRTTTGAFNIQTAVSAGDTVSFVIDSGEVYNGDETSIRATIDRLPPTGTMIFVK